MLAGGALLGVGAAVVATVRDLDRPGVNADGTIDGVETFEGLGNRHVETSVDYERLPAFLVAYLQGPQNPEPGAPCSGGLSQPAPRPAQA